MRGRIIHFVFFLLSARTFALDPQAIDDVLNQTVTRQEQTLALQVAKPYPATGLWRYENFALAAYWLNTSNTVADAGLIACTTNGLFEESITNAGFHWDAYLQERIYFLFSRQSAFFPGRMSIDAENAILKMLWDWASSLCRIDLASTNTINWYWGSENHHAQAWVSFWGAAQIFKNHPDYQNRTYADGSTPAQMASAFNEYFKVYVRDRALKGCAVEVASPTYAKYTLNAWLNLADFATDPDLKAGAGMLLDIYWADWAVEQINGVRGGSRHRCYTGQTSIQDSGGQQDAWYFFGLGSPLSRHPGVMSAATTLWRPSRATTGLALDTEGRGSYEYYSRRLGLLDKSPSSIPGALGTFSYSALYENGGSLLRTTWCTPDFVMGISQIEARPEGDWVGISSQNHWNGVIFGGHATARIFTQRPLPTSGSVYNDEWGVQKKGVMILQRIKEAKSATGQMIWFDFSLNRRESSGWIFVEAPRAYAAVRIVDGRGFWKPDSTNQQHTITSTNVGEWLVLTNQYSPVIIEVARKQDYVDLDAFEAEILANPLVWNGSQLDYGSVGYNTKLTLFADESASPRVDGVPLDFSPVKAYDCPYIQGDFNGGSVIINYGNDRTVLGVAPFANDTNTVALWHFDEAGQDAYGTYYTDDCSDSTRTPVHARKNNQSANSISIIPDGKFGNAIRCELEAGDQYLMTGSSVWPADKGTFRWQGWIRLNSGDTGGYIFHVYDQISLSMTTSNVTFSINKNGILTDTSSTNLITISAAISVSNKWQYIDAVYDGAVIRLSTEVETVSAAGVGPFIPNVRDIYIGSRKNKSNFVGDLDEAKLSAPGVGKLSVFRDDDKDGMSDEWEAEYFGGLGVSNGADDSDGDGLSDLKEYWAGTDPQNPGSLLKISGLSGSSSSNEVVISWQAVNGKCYRILSSTNLLDGVWRITSSGITGIPPENRRTISGTMGNSFFRIETE